jgi:hypothetical protein
MKDRTRLRLQHMRRGDTGEKLAAAGVDQREFFGKSCMTCDQSTKGSHGCVLMMSGLPENFLRLAPVRSFSWRLGLPTYSGSGQNGCPPRVGLSVVSKDNVVTRAHAWDNGVLRHLQERLVTYVADIIGLPHILDKRV